MSQAVTTLAEDEALAGLVAAWSVVDHHHLSLTFAFDDFAGALAFVNRVGAVAEERGHHPNISFTWGRVTIDIWTHDADALTDAPAAEGVAPGQGLG